MIKTVVKRNGLYERYNVDKIINAIYRAGKHTEEYDLEEAKKLASIVDKSLMTRYGNYKSVDVDVVKDMVEEVLLESEYKTTAKAYILYRDMRDRENSPDIFKRRVNLKPYEYPELVEYVDAIRHSYWVHTEFNYTSDIQDYKVNVSEAERNAIKNAMLAIAQVEVAVKTFWGDIYHRLPKPEIGSVGYTFAESEVRHHDAYSHLLEILGLNNEFERISEIPALSQRVNYLSDSVKLAQTNDDRDYALSILLFSLFIEHVSLFSQFLIIMSFNKHRNLFKGISNVIEATSKEEQIHGLFGIELINIIKRENPNWFDKELEQRVILACKEAYRSECEVIDWIYEAGELDFLPKDVVKEFVKNRLNNSLESIGYEPVFDIDEKLVEQTDWFDDELLTTKHVDFFVKRSVNYTKGARAITGDDLF